MARATQQTEERPKLYIADGNTPTEGLNVAWRPVRCAQHHFDKERCKCPPGPQWRALLATAREVLFGGARGGSKSETGRAWLIQGNPEVPAAKCQPVDISYVNHPRYRALVLRKNIVDLQDWIDRAREFYSHFGAKVTEKPPVIEFPSGAKIVLGHLAEEDAYEKYQGQEFHRMLIEELTQIKSETLYKKVLVSCRSTFWDEKRGVLELRPQIFLTTNPLGPGSGWVKSRFIKLKHRDGRAVKPNEVWTDPADSSLTRLYIPALVKDNPYITADYMAALNDLPEPTRSAWLNGDWDVAAGQFFTDWRANGPLIGDPPNANHVVKHHETELKPWWPRLLAVDWGYKHNSVALWGCQHPNGQLHVYRELVVSGVGSEDFFAEVARQSIADLRGLEQPHMTLYLSPDAFGKKDDINTIAQQAQKGLALILGPESTFLLDETEEEQTAEHFLKTREWQMRQASIVIRRAQNQRVFGWNYMRLLMNFRTPGQTNLSLYNDEEFIRLAHDEGAEKAFAYRAAFTRIPETRPKFIVHDSCPRFIEAIPSAIYDEGTEDVLKTDTPDDDLLDAGRYLSMGFRFETTREPKAEFLARRLGEAALRHPEGLGERVFNIAAKAEQDYDSSPGDAPVFVWRSMRSRMAGLR